MNTPKAVAMLLLLHKAEYVYVKCMRVFLTLNPPFCIPVHVHHTQCPWRFLMLKKYQVQIVYELSQNYDTDVLRYTGKAMSSY